MGIIVVGGTVTVTGASVLVADADVSSSVGNVVFLVVDDAVNKRRKHFQNIGIKNHWSTVTIGTRRDKMMWCKSRTTFARQSVW